MKIANGVANSILFYMRDKGHRKNCLLVTNGLARVCDCGLWNLADILGDGLKLPGQIRANPKKGRSK